MDIEFGSGDVFWTIFWLTLWLAWIAMVVIVFLHIFRDPEMPGVAKAIWAALLLVLPLVGVLLYLCIKGSRVGGPGDSPDWQYVDREVAGDRPAYAQQVGELAKLRDQGIITQAEFESFAVRAKP
jgi:hypothetical protein